MTQTRDLIKKMADFFTSDEFYEKGEDARLALTPDDVRCMNYLLKQRNKALEQEPLTDSEQRIFLAAMGREEKICREVDEKYPDKESYENSLVFVCRSIERKVKKALWE